MHSFSFFSIALLMTVTILAASCARAHGKTEPADFSIFCDVCGNNATYCRLSYRITCGTGLVSPLLHTSFPNFNYNYTSEFCCSYYYPAGGPLPVCQRWNGFANNSGALWSVQNYVQGYQCVYSDGLGSDDTADAVAGGLALWVIVIIVVVSILGVICAPFVICCLCGCCCAECQADRNTLPPYLVAVMPDYMLTKSPAPVSQIAMTALPIQAIPPSPAGSPLAGRYFNLPASPSAASGPPLPPRPGFAQMLQKQLDEQCPHQTPDSVAYFLLNNPSVSRVAAAEWLTQDTGYHRQTLTFLLSQQQYSGLRVDQALLVMLATLEPRTHLAVARVLFVFATCYWRQNAAAWVSGHEAVLTVATSLMAVWRGLLDSDTFVNDGLAMNEPELTREPLMEMYRSMSAQRASP